MQQPSGNDKKRKDVGVGLGLGIGIGLMFGVIFENIGLGLLFGVALGTLMGEGINQNRSKNQPKN